MAAKLRKFLGRSDLRWIRRGVLFARGLWHFGRRFECPCCGWTFRHFVDKSAFFRTTTDSCCPRCNSKARHRRDWLFLRDELSFFDKEHAVLEIAPWWSFGRAFTRAGKLRYFAIDVNPHAPFVDEKGDVAEIPLPDAQFDAVLCIHVLEHVEDDRKALGEIFRVLKPGGWALITVPLLLDEPTREDPSITSPEDRKRVFGEKSHVRYYGPDIEDRLRQAGFEIRFEPAAAIPKEDVARYGLRRDENIWLCTRPPGTDASSA